MKRYLLTLLILLVVSPAYSATIHVPADRETIQEAIDITVDGDTVLIADGIYGGVGNVELDTQGKAITIMSENGPDACFIDCKDLTRAFLIESDETRDTIIRDITIQNGYETTAAAIKITGNSSPSIINCHFENNYAEAYCGAVYIGVDASALIDTCTFHENVASPGVHSAGAIFCSGNGVEIVNCEFSGNTAGWDGGAIKIQEGIDVQVSNCIFSENSSTYGGALYIISMSGSVTALITNCTFTNNTTSDMGGAVQVDAEDADVTFESCHFVGNQTDIHGGAMQLNDFRKCTISNSSFSHNVSTGGGGGGGIDLSSNTGLVVTNTSFESNRASFGGAVLLTTDSQAEFVSCTFTGNSTTSLSNGHGGAIQSNWSIVSITQSSFLDNDACIGGGAIGLYSSESTIESCTFTGNTARMYGGAVYCGDETSAVIGGSAENTNTFSGNASGSGSDIFSIEVPATPITASFNTFEACHGGGYPVWPSEAFDTTGCQFNLDPVTQDMYVSADGDDTNSGLTAAEPVKTVRRAMMHIQGQSGNPVTIHIATGTYSASTNGEFYPLPMLNNVTIKGAGLDQTILDAEDNSTLFMGQFNQGFTATDLCLTNGLADDGGCLFSNSSSWKLNNVTMKNNESRYKGGTMFLKLSTGELNHCIIRDNTAGRAGVGYYKDSTFTVNNSLIIGNTSGNYGGAFNTKNADLSISSCTIAGNTATNEGGCLYSEGSQIPEFTNSIIWNNTPDAFSGSVTPTVSYSDVQDFTGGQNNLDVDPEFVTGPHGDFYLSQTDASQAVDSPCVNSGSALASTFLFGGVRMDQLTTRTDETTDSGSIDMGFHYPAPNSCGNLGCDIYMPSTLFQTGDLCYCDVSVCNTTTDTLTDKPVFVILDVLGGLYFAPDFSPFDYYEITIPPGETVINVLPEFNWPSGAGSLSGVNWYAAMTDPEVSELFGEAGIFTFGWSE